MMTTNMKIRIFKDLRRIHCGNGNQIYKHEKVELILKLGKKKRLTYQNKHKINEIESVQKARRYYPNTHIHTQSQRQKS